MSKILKFGAILCLLMLFSLGLSACENNNQETAKVRIGEVNYATLSEAVQNAQSGDTIKVYDDLNDNKNVVIDKPLTIEGVLKEGQIKPKVYASITVNTNGQTDATEINNIEIIHKGIEADGLNNNTTIGLNLIDGGLTVKSSSIKLDNSSNPSDSASGMIISRKINSQNIMPIVIEGNSFGIYKTNNEDLSGALIIKSNDANAYQNISISEEEIYSKNTFSNNEEANQLISINYSSSPETFSYMVTSSMKNLINALNKNQPTYSSTFIFFPSSTLDETLEEPITVKEQTRLIIEGTAPANFQNSEIDVEGSLLVNGKVQNVTIKRVLPTSYINLGDASDLTTVSII